MYRLWLIIILINKKAFKFNKIMEKISLNIVNEHLIYDIIIIINTINWIVAL